MSWNPTIEPDPMNSDTIKDLETLIIPRARDLGGFEVKRALPAPHRQMVGPFIFFDQMGPAEFLTQGGIDVRPHPHIGLSTVTYLYQGEFEHRDSTGAHQMIYPGEVNLMTAGKGVTHSERTSKQTRGQQNSLFGIQTWIALPEQQEDNPATFEHNSKDNLPLLEGEGKQVRLILGRAWGETAPAKVWSDMFYADAILEAGAKLPLPQDHEDRGLYISQGSINVAGQRYETGQMLVFRPTDAITITAGPQGARCILLGGETLNGPRHIWWNFVASSKERIEEAKQAWAKGDWQNGKFQLPIGDDKDFIPLPGR
ncbi:MAG: pirin family protein [Cohaesibacter sp.]|nr:pirin family protein [Cohaesibacter sp.]